MLDVALFFFVIALYCYCIVIRVNAIVAGGKKVQGRLDGLDRWCTVQQYCGRVSKSISSDRSRSRRGKERIGVMNRVRHPSRTYPGP